MKQILFEVLVDIVRIKPSKIELFSSFSSHVRGLEIRELNMLL